MRLARLADEYPRKRKWWFGRRRLGKPFADEFQHRFMVDHDRWSDRAWRRSAINQSRYGDDLAHTGQLPNTRSRNTQCWWSVRGERQRRAHAGSEQQNEHANFLVYFRRELSIRRDASSSVCH